jgi:hypothetical protein
VLQSLAGGVTALAVSSRKVNAAKEQGVDKYNSSDRGPISDQKKTELRNKYFDMDVEKQRSIFNRHAAKLFQTFSSPVSDNEFLSEVVDDQYVEEDWRIIEEPSISVFPFRAGFASMDASTWNGTPSASLRVHKWTKDFKLSLTVQPEINRAYMVVSHRMETDSGSKHFIVEEQDNTLVLTSSSCYTSEVCKQETLHLTYCASDPGCFPTELYCCPDDDDCYWGQSQHSSCGETCCSGCRYHCYDECCSCGSTG